MNWTLCRWSDQAVAGKCIPALLVGPPAPACRGYASSIGKRFEMGLFRVLGPSLRFLLVVSLSEEMH